MSSGAPVSVTVPVVFAERRPTAHVASPIVDVDKRFASARARLGLAGYQLHFIDDGQGGSALFVQRWDRSRTLPDLDAVDHFIDEGLGSA